MKHFSPVLPPRRILESGIPGRLVSSGSYKFRASGFCRRARGAFVGLIGVLTCGAFAGIAEGSIVPTAADIPAAQALGAAQDDTVWVKGQAVGTIYYSGTLIRGEEHDYVLTVGHGVRFPSGTFSPSQITVGNGTSFLNDLGATTGVSSIFVSPTYVAGSDSGFDYAFLQLTNRISTPGLIFNMAPTPQDGASVLFAGFGVPGTKSGESVSNSGNVMGFYGSFSTAGPAGWNSADDLGRFTGLPDSAVGSSQDSGGSVKSFNNSTGQWENVGTMVGASSSSTTFLNYNNSDQDFNNFLTNVVRPVAAIPKPPSITLVVGPTAIQISWSGLVPAREYRVMRSAAVSGWQEAHRFTATSTTGSWSEALAPDGRMFYRLEWNE